MPENTVRAVQPVLTLETTAFNREQVDAQNAVLQTRNEAQVVLAGRSNVGKSSLVNALAGRKSLAKTSATPGKTRSVNFYRASGPFAPFTVTDLPGYGYAQCSKGERESWARLIDHHLSTAPGIRAVVLLIDCRLTPQRSDRDLADFARAKGLPILPVLTKADKCTQAEQAARSREWAAILGGERPVVVSSVTRRGIHDVWTAFARLCESAAADAE